MNLFLILYTMASCAETGDARWETTFHSTHSIVEIWVWSLGMIVLNKYLTCLNYRGITSKYPLCRCGNTSWVFKSGVMGVGSTVLLTETSMALYFIIALQWPTWGCARLISTHFSSFTTQHSPQPHNTQWIKLMWKGGAKSSKWNEECETTLSPFFVVNPCRVSEHRPIVDNAILWF